MALTDHALTTVATVNTELGTSGEDTYIERLISSVSEQISSYCNRTFYYEAGIEEDVSGFARTRLVVSRTPIVAVASITYDDETVSSSNYSISDANAGFIYRSEGWLWTAGKLENAAVDTFPGSEEKLYTVTYSGGYITPQQDADDETLTRNLPYDLEDACVQLVTARYRSKGRNPYIESEKVLSASQSFFAGSVPPAVMSTLNKYKRLVQA